MYPKPTMEPDFIDYKTVLDFNHLTYESRVRKISKNIVCNTHIMIDYGAAMPNVGLYSLMDRFYKYVDNPFIFTQVSL